MIITIVREAVEEIRCFLRDKEVNSQIYSKLSTRGELLEDYSATRRLKIFILKNVICAVECICHMHSMHEPVFRRVCVCLQNRQLFMKNTEEVFC